MFIYYAVNFKPLVSKMKKALVLIKVEPGKEESVFNEMTKKNFVIDAKIVFGDYDVVTTITYEKEQDLESLILNNIGSIDGVKSTMTLIIAKEMGKE